MASPSAPNKEAQPKVVQKLLLRTLLLVLAFGGILYAIRSCRASQADQRRGEKANTVGWIAAIEYHEDGQEAVAIAPDLTIHRATGWRKGAMDRDVAWGPGGNFVYFVSDRTEDTVHVYRWNPTTKDAEVRTIGKRGRSNPTFPMSPEAGSQSMLITSGGIVMEFDPSQRTQVQVLPPVGREITVGGEGDEQGAQSQFSAVYGSLGSSFRVARWAGNDDHIVAIMRRDEGEILVAQSLVPKNGEIQAPMPIAAGDKIEFDVAPDGRVVFAVQGFQWVGNPPPQFVKDGKVTRPFRHYAAIWSPSEPMQPPIVASGDDQVSFQGVAIHPDGQTFITAVGPYKDGAVQREGFVSFPVKPGGGPEGKQLIRGEVYEPSWDPTGTLLVYAKRGEDGKRTIYTANRDGSSERSITGGKGNFAFPRFSPQR